MSNTVSKLDVAKNMRNVEVKTIDVFGKPVTFVAVKMVNGFTICETTTCVDPANYSEEIGRDICLERIEDQVWLLLGYGLQDELYWEPK